MSILEGNKAGNCIGVCEKSMANCPRFVLSDVREIQAGVMVPGCLVSSIEKDVSCCSCFFSSNSCFLLICLSVSCMLITSNLQYQLIFCSLVQVAGPELIGLQIYSDQFYMIAAKGDLIILEKILAYQSRIVDLIGRELYLYRNDFD